MPFGVFSAEKPVIKPPVKEALPIIPLPAPVCHKAPEVKKPLEDFGKCPNCGSILVVRQNKTTKSFFCGCSNFPKCKFSSDIPEPKPSPRGMTTLDNGVTIYYAEDWKSLNHYRGMRAHDVGIIRQKPNKGDVQLLSYDYEEGWILLDTEEGGVLTEDAFEEDWDEEDGD